MQTQQFIAISDPEQQQEAEAIIRSCVHCGFCNAACPTYQVIGNENDGPRGRIYLIKQVLEGAAVTAKTQQHLDRCLTCRACETSCPSGVQYGKLLDVGREVIERQVERNRLDNLKRRLLCLVLPYPSRFIRVVALLKLIFPLLPESIARKLPVNPTITPDALAVTSNSARKVLLLDGCVQPVLAPEINTALERVLGQLGIGVFKAPGAGCCGALSFHLSFQEAGLDFMRRNIDAWLPYLEQGIDAIITTASGCGVMVKDYGAYLKHDAAYKEKAERISAACKDIVEILEEADLTALQVRTSHKKLAFQSPCTLQHGQKLNGKVEILLSGLGFELLPVSNPHSCCGSAGVYSLLQPALSNRLLADKLSALESACPDEIATANIGCLLHLRSMASVPVRHWIEILADGLV